jgi:GNAT superfamily N-acetyltransferase
VAEYDSLAVGMFGPETVATGVIEVRRMYVAPDFRRRGIARAILASAEEECRTRRVFTIVVSTSKLQPVALNLYRASDYRLTDEAGTQTPTNETIAGGTRCYHFMKRLSDVSIHES